MASSTLLNTNNVTSSAVSAEEGEDFTLLQKVKKLSSSNITKFDFARRKIIGAVEKRRFATVLSSLARPISKTLADVTKFDRLIDDREVFFRQLSGIVSPVADDGRIFLCCDDLHYKAADVEERDRQNSLAVGLDSCLLAEMTTSFLASLARWVNDKTHVCGLSAGFLSSLLDANLIWCGNKDAIVTTRFNSREVAVYLLSHIFEQLEHNYIRADKELDRLVSVPVKLRMLRPDKTGRWPKNRSARAILHKDYRDDIGHLWLMSRLAELIPTGRVARYTFDGNLMKGAILFPEISRTEKDSDYSGGLFFFSGEVGNRRAGVMPFLFRAASMSVTIVGDAWGVTHRRSEDLEKVGKRLSAYVHSQIPLITVYLDRMLDLQNILLDNSSLAVERLIIAISLSFQGKLTLQDLRLWNVGIKTEENLFPRVDFSAFVLQNGLTRMSQGVEDEVRQIQLDSLAGKFVNLDWDKLVARSQTISDEQVSKVFCN